MGVQHRSWRALGPHFAGFGGQHGSHNPRFGHHFLGVCSARFFLIAGVARVTIRFWLVFGLVVNDIGSTCPKKHPSHTKTTFLHIFAIRIIT